MKIVFFGDSITDMSHHNDQEIFSYGSGFLMYVAGELYREDPKKYRVINKGIGGNRVADLYSRVKTDVWYERPDVVSILIGVNDVWQEVDIQNEKKDFPLPIRRSTAGFAPRRLHPLPLPVAIEDCLQIGV